MKKLLLLMLAVVLAFGAYGVPAYPGLITVTQKDGTKISYYLHGDEHFSFKTTEDGYLLVANEEGVFEYAKINGQNSFVATGVKAHNMLDRSVNEQNYVSGLQKADALASDLKAMRTEQMQRQQSRMPAANGGPRRFPLKGSPKGLIILVSYSDLAFRCEKSDFENMANQVDYSDNRGTGSIRDYFIEASFNQFTPDFDVYGPYTLPHDRAYYGAETTTQNDARAQEMISDACYTAEAAGLDFSQYDNDGDGIVDNVFVYYAGHNQAEGGGAECIWPHRSRVTDVEVSGKTVSDYACTSEYSGAAGSSMCGIGTFCHEFSHVLGLPDFYDTDDASGLDAMSSWDLMTSGNYNNNGRTPPTYTAYERFFIGWLTPTALVNDSTVDCEGAYSLKSLISSNTAYLISETKHNLSGSGPNPKEFFMMEYRKKEGRDTYSGLPEGLLITHINYNSTKWSRNGPNNDKTELGYQLVLPGNNSEGHQASFGSSDVYPYGNIDYAGFILHGQNKQMKRMVQSISNQGDSCTFLYVTQNDQITVESHDIDAYESEPAETQFVVKGIDVYEPLSITITDNRRFTYRVHGDSVYHSSLKIYPDTLGLVLDTIDIRYAPDKMTYDAYDSTRFTVKGDSSASLTKIVYFKYRNRRNVYVTTPVADSVKNVSPVTADLSWSFVADTTAGTKDIQKYGAKYYVDVYRISDETETITESFEDFPDKMTEGWSANFSTYTTVYRKDGNRAAQFEKKTDTIYTQVFPSDITNCSFWLYSISSKGTFYLEAQNSETGEWVVAKSGKISKTFEQDMSVDFNGKYNRLRFSFRPDTTNQKLAIDKISVQMSQKYIYAYKNEMVRDTFMTATGLTTNSEYHFNVRATDKDEKETPARYENVTERSNEIVFNTGKVAEASEGQLVCSYDAATGTYQVFLPELKEGYVLFVSSSEGIVAYKVKPTENVVTIPSLASGLYIVRYSAENKWQKSDSYGKIIYRGVGKNK